MKNEEIKKELKLSQPCAICKKDIFIGDIVIWEKEAYHIPCLLKSERENALREQIKLTDYAIVDPANVVGLFPFIKKDCYEGLKAIDCSLGFFKLHESPKMKMMFDWNVTENVLEVEGSRYSLELIDQTRQMAKVWFNDKPQVFLQYNKEKEIFLKDKPLMLIYGDKMCFVIAPRIEQ
jgi:hypothetical protein